MKRTEIDKNGRRVRPQRRRDYSSLPKLCGADIELGNFVAGLDSTAGTGYAASRLLLREIDGLPTFERLHRNTASRAGRRRARGSSELVVPSNGKTRRLIKPAGQPIVSNPRDWGRKYLPSNGGCAYIDLDHLELCLPEVLSAYDHVACWHAMLRIARAALETANEKLPSGCNVHVLVNNSDGQGNSYGSHLNFLITRGAWHNIFRRKMQYMLYLAAFQASSIVYTGQGKVGSENGAPEVAFQLSQRADFIETLVGTQTTHNRPMVNSRDEPLSGSRSVGAEAPEMARLHVIFFDNTLCQVASLLKVGVMQIVLSMIEAEEVNVELLLDDPVDALLRWSHDPELEAVAKMTSGEMVTAVELQLRFLNDAKEFISRGGCAETVPRSSEILALWEDTLLKLHTSDFDKLAPRLDWVLKHSVLQRVLDERPDLRWDSPEIKHLDHIYSSLDSSEGLYWSYDESFVERVVTDDQIDRFTIGPPENTRAWTRAMLLRTAGSSVDDVEWDSMRFKTNGERCKTTYRNLEMASPLAFTKEQSQHAFEQATTLDGLLDALESSGETDKGAGRAFSA